MSDLSYELAQQLKEVGFPGEIKEGDKFWHIGGADSPDRPERFLKVKTIENMSKTGNERHLKIPTLEELIEACKDKKGLGVFTLRCDISRNDWTATLIKFKGGEKIEVGEGKTPIEAVAKLVIKLKKQHGSV